MDSAQENGSRDIGTALEPVEGEQYEELLNRYERVLVFAGGLQEKLKSQKLLAEKNEDLALENTRLRRVLSAGEAYIRVLEAALRAMGLPCEASPALAPKDGGSSDERE